MSYTSLSIASKWVKVTFAFGSFQTGAITNSITGYVLPAKTQIEQTKIDPTVAFAGGLIATATLSIGIGGNLVKYSAAKNVFTGSSVAAASLIAAPDVESMSASTNILLTMVSTVANLSSLAAGSVDVYLKISQLP